MLTDEQTHGYTTCIYVSWPVHNISIISNVIHYCATVWNLAYLLNFITTFCDTRTITLLYILTELFPLFDLENYTSNVLCLYWLTYAADDTCGPWITLVTEKSSVVDWLSLGAFMFHNHFLFLFVFKDVYWNYPIRLSNFVQIILCRL